MLRATKIIATLGPASEKPEVLRDMIRAGVDVVRMNFSHGTIADHKARHDLVRTISAEVGKEVDNAMDAIEKDNPSLKDVLPKVFARGNLDPANAAQVFDVLMQIVRETGLSALIATHNMDLAARMDRVVRLQDGQIV